MLKMVLKSKWPVYINKSIENLKFPMIWLDYYLGQTLNVLITDFNIVYLLIKKYFLQTIFQMYNCTCIITGAYIS